MKSMLCTINSSIWICCKTCYKTTKALCSCCTLCGPASGFHKAVSVYHTWLSNNPVVGQTQLYPADTTPHKSCAGQASIHPQPFSSFHFVFFVFSLNYVCSRSEYRTRSSSLISPSPPSLSAAQLILCSAA